MARSMLKKFYTERALAFADKAIYAPLSKFTRQNIEESVKALERIREPDNRAELITAVGELQDAIMSPSDSKVHPMFERWASAMRLKGGTKDLEPFIKQLDSKQFEKNTPSLQETRQSIERKMFSLAQKALDNPLDENADTYFGAFATYIEKTDGGNSFILDNARQMYAERKFLAGPSKEKTRALEALQYSMTPHAQAYINDWTERMKSAGLYHEAQDLQKQFKHNRELEQKEA